MPGESADYVIRARIVAGDATGPGAKSAEKRLVDVEKRGLAVGASLMRMFALVGGIAGIGALGRGIISLNSSMEDARLGIAGMFNATSGVDMATGFRIATTELATLRKMAASGAGELSEYVEVFQNTFLPLRNAGADLERINRLIAQTVAVGHATGRGAEGARLLGFDLQQALTAGAGQRTTPILNQVLAGIGMTTAGFNQLSAAAKLTKLEEAFGKWQGAVDAFGLTWGARYSTFIDNMKGIARQVSKPLFDRWSDQLSKVNDWLVKNEDKVAALADVWWQRLLKVWDHLVARAGTYAAIIAATAAIQMMPPGAGGAIKGAGSAVGGFGRGLAESYRWGSTLPGRAGLMGSLSGGGAAVLGQLGASGSAALQVLGKLAWPLAIVTTAFLAIKGAIGEFPAVTGYFMSAWGRLTEAFGGLGDAFGTLTTKGSALNLVGAGLLGIFGGLIDAFGIAVRVIASLAVGLGVVFQIVGMGLQSLWKLIQGDLSGASAAWDTDGLMAANKTLKDIWTFGDTKAGAKGEDGAPLSDLPNGRTKKGGDTNIGTVNVVVKQEANADPARVARVFDEVLERIGRNKTQAARNPVLSPG